jgi:hypothetical protein
MATKTKAKYMMYLTSVGNPDRQQYAPVSTQKKVTGKTLREMQEKARAYQQFWNLGGGNWTNPVVWEGDKVVGFFNYSLTLFQGGPPQTIGGWKKLIELDLKTGAPKPKEKPAMKAVRTRIVSLIRKGRVRFTEVARGIKMPTLAAPRAPLEQRIKKNPVKNIEFRSAWGRWRKRGFKGSNGGFTVGWGMDEVGFGELTVKLDRNGKLLLNTEHMGRDFAKKILCALVDSAGIED